MRSTRWCRTSGPRCGPSSSPSKPSRSIRSSRICARPEPFLAPSNLPHAPVDLGFRGEPILQLVAGLEMPPLRPEVGLFRYEVPPILGHRLLRRQAESQRIEIEISG